jgi:hypothetical protein
MAYDDKNKTIMQPQIPNEPAELAAVRRANNPSNEPVGHFTGRCRHCGSKDLWDDNLHYGCNSCKALLS